MPLFNVEALSDSLGVRVIDSLVGVVYVEEDFGGFLSSSFLKGEQAILLCL